MKNLNEEETSEVEEKKKRSVIHRSASVVKDFGRSNRMATLGLIEYKDASPEVRAVYDDIMATRKTDWINNFWKAIAHDPVDVEADLGRYQADHGSGRARSSGERIGLCCG